MPIYVSIYNTKSILMPKGTYSAAHMVGASCRWVDEVGVREAHIIPQTVLALEGFLLPL